MFIELTACIKVIRPESRAVFPYSNSLYIDDERQTLIDAGSGRAYQHLAPEKIETLLFSHYHFDHVHGWPYFPRAQFMAGQEERWAFEDETKYHLSAGYQYWEKLMGQKKSMNWNRTAELPDDVLVKPGFQPITLMGTFKDGDRLNMGQSYCIALHTPGHTPGHYSFYFPQEKILFSGDLDLSPRGPWYGGAYSDFDDLLQSVERLIQLNPDVLVSSHRKVFEGDVRPLLRQYIDIALERERKILRYLDQPRSFREIMSLGLSTSGDGSKHELFWNRMMINKHLERFYRHGWIYKREDGSYVRY